MRPRPLFKTCDRPIVLEKATEAKVLYSYFENLGYSVKEIFDIDISVTRINYLLEMYDKKALITDEFVNTFSMILEFLHKYEANDFKMPSKRTKPKFQTSTLFYDYVKYYLKVNGNLPKDEIVEFYGKAPHSIQEQLMSDFENASKQIEYKPEKKIPTIEELRIIMQKRKCSKRKSQEKSYGVYERTNITEHTFSLEEFGGIKRDVVLFPYMEYQEFTRILIPVLNIAIPCAFVKAIINQQLVNVILIDQELCDEDMNAILTYLRDNIPSEYWKDLYIKRVNEYDIQTIRPFYDQILDVQNAMLKQSKDMEKHYAIRVDRQVIPLRLMSLWLHSIDGVNGILMMSPEELTQKRYHFSANSRMFWKRIVIDEALEAEKIEKGILVYHDFQLESFSKLIKDVKRMEEWYILEKVIDKKYLTPKFKKWLLANNTEILPYQEFPTEKKIVEISKIGGKEQLDTIEMFHVGKYLESIMDYINLAKTAKRYREVVEMYTLNPITLEPKEMKVFSNLNRYYNYQTEAKFRKIMESPEWEWHRTNYSTYLLKIKSKGDSCLEVQPLYYENRPPEELLKTSHQIDPLDEVFTRYKEFEPYYLN